MAVFIFAVLFGALLEDHLALLPPPPRHRPGDRRLRDAAAVHDQLDAGELHPPGASGGDGPRRRDPRGVLCRVRSTTAAPSPPGPAPERRPVAEAGQGGRTCSWSAPRRPGPRPCTTTLARHPAIYMSPMKEPHYFSRIEPSPERRGVLSARHRRGRLPGAVRRRHRRGAGRRGEHLVPVGRPRPPSGSSDRVPEASILIMLRDPVERAYSQYWNDVREGLEKREFLDALAEERRAGPGAWGVTSLYIDCGRYADQVSRYLDAFGRPCPRLALRGLHRRRGARRRPRSSSTWASSRRGRGASSGRMNPGLDAPQPAQRALLGSGRVRTLARATVPRRARRAAARRPAQAVGPPPMDPAARASLDEVFRPEVERLGRAARRGRCPWEPGGGRSARPRAERSCGRSCSARRSRRAASSRAG